MTPESLPRNLERMGEGHRRVVIGLAAEAHVPVDIVADAYRRELLELESRSRVMHFVPIIASRRVRQRLRKLAAQSNQ